MTRSDTNKKVIVVAGRAFALIGLASIVGIALAQDTASRYARLLADAEITAQYNTFIERQLESQQAEIAALEAQIEAMDATALDVPTLVQRMFDDLDRFVASDVPFFRTERTDRIERLRQLMNSVDTMPSEKYRRLLEAYQIEMEYGRTMDAYREPLSDGREADFVRLGRVSLMYRTVDGEETGYWDNQQKTWVIDDDYDRAIEEALGIASEEVAPDIIAVPVPAPQEVRS
jgi:Protein of unknown function (DUF3450)